MSLYKIWFLGLVIAVSQLGCSSTPNNGINYRESVIAPTLELPPDLVSPASDRNLELPGSSVGKPENTGRFVETGNLNVQAKALPEIGGITIHNDGGVYSLSVNRPAAEVYPLVKQFWADQGFRLIKDEPLIGIQETEWLSIKSGDDSFFSSMLASLRAAESRDQYLTRVERNGDSAARVFIAHRGQELVIDENTDALDSAGLKSGWQFVPSDSAKEVEMLSRLMIFLGAQNEQVQQQLAQLDSLQPRASLALNRDDQPFVLVQGGIRQTLNRLRYRMDKLAVELSDKMVKSDEAILELDRLALVSLGVLKPSDQSMVVIHLQGSVNSNTTRIDVLGKSGRAVHDSEDVSLMNFLIEQLK